MPCNGFRILKCDVSPSCNPVCGGFQSDVHLPSFKVLLHVHLLSVGDTLLLEVFIASSLRILANDLLVTHAEAMN